MITSYISGDNIILSPVNQTDIDKAIIKLLANKTVVTPTHTNIGMVWKIEGHGVTATASLFEGALKVTILHKPFYIAMFMIESGLREAFGV